MPTGRGGVFASQLAQGSVGTGVLKRLDVTFNYGRRRLLVAPLPAMSRTDPVDHSGLWLSLEDRAWRVDHVSAGSAASMAGLRAGQRVLAVDGRPVAHLKLPGIRQRWAEHGPGLQTALTVAEPDDRSAPRELQLVLCDRFIQEACRSG